MKARFAHAAKDLRFEVCKEYAPGPVQLRVKPAQRGIRGAGLPYCNRGGFGRVRTREPRPEHAVLRTGAACPPEPAGVSFDTDGGRELAMNNVQPEFASC